MKNIHIFIYGLLVGAVLVLSSVLLLEIGDGNEATAQSNTMKSGDILMATGQVQGNEHMLWILAPNTDPDNDNMTLLGYTARNYEPELVGARSIKYDRRLIDAVFRRGNPQGKGKPPVSKMADAYKRNKKDQKNDSSD